MASSSPKRVPVSSGARSTLALLLSLCPAPVIPLGPDNLLTATPALSTRLFLNNPSAWAACSTTSPIKQTSQRAPAESAHLPPPPSHTIGPLQPLIVPAVALSLPTAATALAGGMAGQERQVVVASTVQEEAEHSCALVISLKEDSERRRQRAFTRQSHGSPQSPLDNAADGGILAPPSPRSTDMSVTNSSASTSDISLSMSNHSPVLDSATHEVPSPPPIGPLKELHARSSSLHNAGKLLFASPDNRFGLDDAMDEFGNLSPPAVFTPPRRGSFSGAERKGDEYEPLDALAYLQSLTSTPCSSSSSGLSPGVSTTSTPIRPIPPVSAGPAVHQSLTAARTNDEIDSHHSRALRELQHHQYQCQQQSRQQLNPRGSLYTVATVAPSVPAAEMAALHAIQQRTIAAKLTGSNTQQSSSNESDSEAAAIIVKQQLHQQSSPSRSTASKRKRTKKKSVRGKKSHSGSNVDRRLAAKDSEKENKRPQQCEQCHRKQANTEYGTGRFCGPTCARTFSITKRYTTKKKKASAIAISDDEAGEEVGGPGEPSGSTGVLRVRQ